MPPFKKGVEDLPLRHFDKDPYPIMVFVYDLTIDPDEGEPIVATYQLDYSNFEDRKHLGRLTHHAIRNKLSIETMALKDAEGEIG